jgi:hypothetical protein
VLLEIAIRSNCMELHALGLMVRRIELNLGSTATVSPKVNSLNVRPLATPTSRLERAPTIAAIRSIRRIV